ncbi:MAG: glycosyltransferase family 2 protein, partial [Kiritimatiellae bacterium]|nr:glycosyltransferase family 2 protein [Kiritimatiellia bacterium]
IEALEINKDTDSERTPRGGTAPFQNQVSQLASRIAYYVGDVNRTKPAFIARSETFSVEIAAELVLNTVLHQLPTTNHQSPITNIAVIILIGQEKIHLKRCVEKLAPLNPRQIFLVESQPDDGGVAIAKETAAKLGLRLESTYHKWPGNQAVQFNWALDALCASDKRKVISDKRAEWILRLDADEYLTEETCERIVRMFDCSECSIDEDVAGFTLELKRKFMGGEIRHATNGIRQVRLFRRGKGRYPESLMDERIQVDGKVIDFDGAFYDDNLNGLEWWKNKHRGYAKREAEQAIAGTFQDPRKASYYKLPRYLRSVMYFCIRYFLKGGFLDGKAGWRWNFWQGLWYRWIVDREISRRLKS